MVSYAVHQTSASTKYVLPQNGFGPIWYAKDRERRNAYGLVRAEKISGNAIFLDWGNIRRNGNIVQGLVFEVLGDDLARATMGSLVRRSSLEIGCAQKLTAVAGVQVFDRGLKPQFPERLGPVALRPIAGSPLRADLLASACEGQRPQQTFATMEEAVTRPSCHASWTSAEKLR